MAKQQVWFIRRYGLHKSKLGIAVSSNESDEQVFDLSPKKLVVLIIGTLALIALGVWMIFLDEETIQAFRRFNSPAFVHGFGFLLIVLAGLGGLTAVRRLCGDRRGLVLNTVGLLDCTSGISGGIVPWSEVAGVEIVKLPTQTVLAVRLKEPNKYLERQSPVKRAFLLANHKMCGSPVALSVNLLKAKPAELLMHVSRYKEMYCNA